MTQTPAAGAALAERFSSWACGLSPGGIPPAVEHVAKRLLLDAGGLMVAARHTDYVGAVVASRDGAGNSSAIGHPGTYTLSDAAIISGTGIHGEDFDDTFEGTPVHVGAVIVPAVLTAAEAEDRTGADVLRGIAVGGELMCRMAVVAPTAIHRAGFHPTAVIGALGAAAGVSVALGSSPKVMASALGVAGSMSAGIIEYLAEGASTKRLHPGWAAAAGIRAARLARADFSGPRTVLDGVHGFFHAFADSSIEADLSQIDRALGDEWYVERLAFKPYACGTMIQPFIDCAVSLRGQIDDPGMVDELTAFVGEGTVHRLWEAAAEKARPSTPYSAKFSGPYGIAIGIAEGAGGLEQFTQEKIETPAVLALASKIRYVVDPDNEYPRNYTGRVTAVLSDGRRLSAHQDCLRGGVRAPLSDEELVAKYRANVQFGGWPIEVGDAFQRFVEGLFASKDISGLSAFRR